jgi:hypothetical protein
MPELNEKIKKIAGELTTEILAEIGVPASKRLVRGRSIEDQLKRFAAAILEQPREELRSIE